MEGWRHRHVIRRLLTDTPTQQSLADLSSDDLSKLGITALALDFDGVLAPHGADCPLPELEAWLRKAVAQLGSRRVVILSNRPEGPRIDWFSKQFPGVSFIGGVRKKPYPDGLKKTGELTGAPLSEILMVDDRLLTGCLAAVLAGCKPFYVRSPYIDLRNNLYTELFFMAIRWTERIFVRLFA